MRVDGRSVCRVGGAVIAALVITGCGGTSPTATTSSTHAHTAGGEVASDALHGALDLASSPALLAATELCGRVREADAAIREGGQISIACGQTPPEHWEAYLAFCRSGAPLWPFLQTDEQRRTTLFRGWERALRGQLAPANSTAQCDRNVGGAGCVCTVFSPASLVTAANTNERGILTGSLDVAGLAAGLAQALEERARQEFEIYVATTLGTLLCAPATEGDPLAPRELLRNSCEVLDGYRSEGEMPSSLSWDTLRDALENDIRRLPEALAGSRLLVDAPEALPLRLALYLVAELRESTDPGVLIGRLIDRLLLEPAIPPDVRSAVLALRAIVSLAQGGTTPDAAVLGLVTTVALEAAIATQARHAAALRTRARRRADQVTATVDEPRQLEGQVSALLDESLPLQYALARLCPEGAAEAECVELRAPLQALVAANEPLAEVERSLIAARALVDCAPGAERERVRAEVIGRLRADGQDITQPAGACGEWGELQAAIGTVSGTEVGALKTALGGLPALEGIEASVLFGASVEPVKGILSAGMALLGPHRSQPVSATPDALQPRARSAVDWAVWAQHRRDLRNALSGDLRSRFTTSLCSAVPAGTPPAQSGPLDTLCAAWRTECASGDAGAACRALREETEEFLTCMDELRPPNPGPPPPPSCSPPGGVEQAAASAAFGFQRDDVPAIIHRFTELGWIEIPGLGSAQMAALRDLRTTVADIASAMAVISAPETTRETRSEQVAVVVGHYARALELAVRLVMNNPGFHLPHSVPALLQAAVSGDPGRIVAAVLDVLAELATHIEDLPAGIVRGLSFAGQVVQAESSEEVRNAVHAFAAPVGSWRGKRHDGGWRLYLNGLVGFTAGGEYYLGRVHQAQATDAAGLGAHVSLGFHVNIADTPVGPMGMYVPLIDVTPYTSLAAINDVDVESIDPLSFLSPGLYYFWGIGDDTPFVLAAGLSFTPRGRALTYGAVAGDQGSARVDVFRVQVVLGVDVTLFPF